LAQCILVTVLLVSGAIQLELPSAWKMLTAFLPVSVFRLAFSVLRAVALKHLSLPLFAMLNVVKFPLTYIVGIFLGKEASNMVLWSVCIAVSAATCVAVLEGPDQSSSTDGDPDAPDITIGIAASLGATVSDIAVMYLIQRVAKGMPSIHLMAYTSPVYFILVAICTVILELPDMKEESGIHFSLVSTSFLAAICICSIVICLVEFRIIGKFGALVFSMVYRLQGIIVFAIGAIFLHQPCNLIQICSYSFAAALLLIASYWKLMLKKQAAEEQSNKQKEEEPVPVSTGTCSDVKSAPAS